MMKKQTKFWIMSMLAASLFVTAACNDDDDNGPSEGVNQKNYALGELDGSGVSGTVTFIKQNDSTTNITIQLTGTVAGNSHPAHIHGNPASNGGPILLDFNPVDGATGKSETMVTRLNDGTPITYEELITFNGHVNVHKSSTELAIMIAQGNIGSNASGEDTDSGNNGTGGNDNGGY